MSDRSAAPPISGRSWLSLYAVLIVQAQNAFNDNFVKFVLTGLAMVVAAGTAVGNYIQYILFILIPLPFVLLAPVAGYLSDRFAKSRIIFGSLVFQLILFVMIAAAVYWRSVEIAIFGYFLLAVQSAIFSPAKQGILKEIVGSNRLGFANGLMSMLTMFGILAGMLLSGKWFDGRLARLNEENGMELSNGWEAALIPILYVAAACVVAILLGKLVQKTPDHPGEKFSRAVWLRHFRHLQQLFHQHRLRNVALFITGYWFIANYLGIVFVNFATVLFPEAGEAGRMESTAEMLTWVGGGLIVGSTLVSLLSRDRIRLALAPIGGVGMVFALFGIGLFPPGELAWNLSLSAMGFTSGFYVVPLNAWLQDLAEEEHRARIISALNLMTSLSGVIAVGTGFALDVGGVSPSGQVLIVTPLFATLCFLLVRFLRGNSSESDPA